MLELSNQILKMVHLLLICQEQELIPDANLEDYHLLVGVPTVRGCVLNIV